MKKSTIITALTAIMMMAVTPAFAQEENGFKKFNVRERTSQRTVSNGSTTLSCLQLATRRKAMP